MKCELCVVLDMDSKTNSPKLRKLCLYQLKLMVLRIDVRKKTKEKLKECDKDTDGTETGLQKNKNRGGKMQ